MRKRDDDANLFKGIRLPTWCANRTYALFQAYSTIGLSPEEDDEYTRQFMQWVKMSFTQKGWHHSLSKVRIDPSGVAQELVMHLRRKTETLVLRKPCLSVFKAIINRIISNFIITKIKDKAKRRAIESSEVDYFLTKLPSGDSPDDLEGIFAPTDCGDIEKLSKLLHEAENDICADIPKLARGANIFDVVKVYRLARRALLLKNELPLHVKIPHRLRRVVPSEMHGLIVSRVTRVLYGFAAEGV